MRLNLCVKKLVGVATSLLIIAGCGGGGGNGGSFGSPDINGAPSGAPTTTLSTELVSSAEATSLTGPLLYQTGNTVVGGTEDVVGFGFATPPFFINTDPSSNTISDDFGGAFTPDVVYDELGRGVQIIILVDGAVAPIIDVAYNDDNTIASTSQTTPDGDVRIQTDFIYESGRLIGKEITDVNSTRSITYNYTDEGMLASGSDEITSFEFTVDELGRVTGVIATDIFEGNLVREATITYDASGNITELEDFQDFTGLETQTNSTYNYTASAEPTVNLVGFFAAINDLFIPNFSPVFAGTGS